MNITLLGPPGVGRSTQAGRLSAALGIPHIEMSKLLRDAVRTGAASGHPSGRHLERGELVPDDITVIDERLREIDTRAGFVLDGFPRTRAQAEALHDVLATQKRRLTGALLLDVPDSILARRVAGRLVCPECHASFHAQLLPPAAAGLCDRCGGRLRRRPEDTAETFWVRLAGYRVRAEALIAYYRWRGLLREICGEGQPDEVCARALVALCELAEVSGREPAMAAAFP